jgi:hypothetical protein
VGAELRVVVLLVQAWPACAACSCGARGRRRGTPGRQARSPSPSQQVREAQQRNIGRATHRHETKCELDLTSCPLCPAGRPTSDRAPGVSVSVYTHFTTSAPSSSSDKGKAAQEVWEQFRAQGELRDPGLPSPQWWDSPTATVRQPRRGGGASKRRCSMWARPRTDGWITLSSCCPCAVMWPGVGAAERTERVIYPPGCARRAKPKEAIAAAVCQRFT